MTQLAEIRNYSMLENKVDGDKKGWIVGTCGVPASRRNHLVVLLPFVLQTCFIIKLYITHCKCLQVPYTPQREILTALFHRYCRVNLCKHLPCSERTLSAAALIKAEAW